MKKIFLSIQFAALMAGLPAFALVGGPFDNGDYSSLLERSGFYQSSFTFKNGNGYAIWTADNAQGVVAQGTTVTQNLSTGSLLTPAAQGTHNANRSVFYYKGVTYFGSAMGQVDIDTRFIAGYCNANSDYSAETTTPNPASTFSLFSTSTTNSASVVASGRSYIMNVNWTGDIIDTAPQLRFIGEGELSIISPNGQETIAGLAYQAYSGLLDAIVSSVAASGNTVFGVTPGLYVDAQNAIAGALSGSPGVPATPEISTTTPVLGQATNTTLVDSDNNPATPDVAVTVPVDVNGNGITNDDLVQVGATVLVNPATTEVPGVPGLDDYLTGTGPEASYDQSENVKIKVTGYRRFF